MLDESWQELVPLAERCAVRIESKYGDFLGSGFFVDRASVLTCAHVVHNWHTDDIRVFTADGTPKRALSLRLEPPQHGADRTYKVPDLALVVVDGADDHSVVWLSTQVPPAWSRAVAAGFSRATPTDQVAADTVTFEVVGSSAPPLLKVKDTRIPAGMSGSLVLDVSSGKVCGLVKAATDEVEAGEGWIVPTTTILTTFPQLVASNSAEHPPGSRWWNLATRRVAFTRRIFGNAWPVRAPVSPVNPPPSWWLDPYNQVVAFHPRPELDSLLTWAEDDRPEATMIKLLWGPGGVGKTRLALELARRLDSKGWIAGILRLDDPSELAPLAPVVTEAVEREHHVLLVLDYAEGYQSEITRLASAVPSESVRILLLTRSVPDWWYWFSPAGLVQRWLVAREPLMLGAFEPIGNKTTAPFESALQEFRRRMQAVVPSEPVPSYLLTRSLQLGDVLKLHALALVATLHELEHGALPDTNVLWRDPLDELVRHEGRHLARSARQLGFHVSHGLIGQLLLVPCLIAARTAIQARDAIDRLPAMVDQPRETVADLLRHLYPPAPTTLRWWGSLPLDRLAETLLIQVITETEEGAAFLAALFKSATTWQAVEGLVLLVRVISYQDVPEPIREGIDRGIDTVVRAEQFALLGALHVAETRVHGSAPHAARYAAQLDGEIALSLAQMMRDSGRHSLYEFALLLLDHIGHITAQARTSKSLLDTVHEDGGMGGQRVTFPPPALVVLRAQILTLLERYFEALQLTEALIGVLRPDVAARAEHDISPSTSVIRLTASDGQVIRMSETAGDTSEELAMALQVHAHALEGDERDEEALAARLEAVAVARRSAVHSPGMVPRLAAFLTELAERHIARGEHDRAEPLLLEMHRLIESLPGSAGIAARTRLASLRDRQGRHDEAAELLRHAGHRPGADPAQDELESDWRPVSSAGAQAMDLAKQGRLAEARSAARAAARQLRRIADQDPDTYTHYLAALLVWAADLEESPDQKLSLADEAVHLLRGRIGPLNPPEEHGLALALLQRCNALEDLSRHSEALDACSEAVEVLDRFAAHAPHKAMPRLATALEYVARVALRVSQPEAALKASHRLAEILQAKVDDPRMSRLSAADSYRFYLTAALAEVANNALAQGQADVASDLLLEALGTAREFLSGEISDHNASAMANRLLGIGLGFSRAGDTTRALETLDTAIEVTHGAGAVQTLVMAHWLRVQLLNESAPFPEVAKAAQALLSVCRLPGVEDLNPQWRQAPRWALDLARGADARTYWAETTALLMDLIQEPSDDRLLIEALVTLNDVVGAHEAPESIADMLIRTLQGHTDPVFVGLITSIAAKLPIASRLPVAESLIASVHGWSTETSHANWRIAAPALLLSGQTLSAAERHDDAIARFMDLISLLSHPADKDAEFLVLAVRRLRTVCRDAGRLSDAQNFLSDQGPDVLAAMIADATVRANTLAAQARSALDSRDIPAAVELTSEALTESYMSGEVAHIHRGHRDHANARRTADPFDPACLAHLVAAGVYGALIGEPFEAGLAGALLQLQAGWHDIGTIAQLARRVDQPPSVRLAESISLATSPETAQGILDQVLHHAMAARQPQIDEFTIFRMQWDPYIAAVVRARQGDHRMANVARSLLTMHEDSPWHGLAQGLLLVMDGQDERALSAARDAADEALVGRCLNAVRGTVLVHRELADAAPIGGLLSKVLRAMRHGRDIPPDLNAILHQVDESGQWDGLVPCLRALIAGGQSVDVPASATATVRAVVELLSNANTEGGKQ